MSSGRGRSLADRSGTASPGPVAEGGGAVAVEATTERSGLRHVWVHDPVSPYRRWPGVLTGWRRDGEGRWIALVAYAVQNGTGTVLITAWLHAGQLSPVGPE